MNTPHEPQRIVYTFFGPPGSGKGTQLDNLLSYYQDRNTKVITMSAGGSLRAIQKENPDALLSHIAREANIKGVSVTGALVTYFWVGPLFDVSAQEPFVYLIDGPCRVEHETELFVDFVQSLGARLVVLEFDLSDEVCMQRMVSRTQHEERNDDDIAVMQRRLEVYRTGTRIAIERLVSYMKKTIPDSSQHLIIDASRTIEEIFDDIIQATN
jgi:adenylate kinase family enzyme